MHIPRLAAALMLGLSSFTAAMPAGDAQKDVLHAREAAPITADAPFEIEKRQCRCVGARCTRDRQCCSRECDDGRCERDD